jgi:hypothetical protein
MQWPSACQAKTGLVFWKVDPDYLSGSGKIGLPQRSCDHRMRADIGQFKIEKNFQKANDDVKRGAPEDVLSVVFPTLDKTGKLP